MPSQTAVELQAGTVYVYSPAIHVINQRASRSHCPWSHMSLADAFPHSWCILDAGSSSQPQPDTDLTFRSRRLKHPASASPKSGPSFAVTPRHAVAAASSAICRVAVDPGHFCGGCRNDHTGWRLQHGLGPSQTSYRFAAPYSCLDRTPACLLRIRSSRAPCLSSGQVGTTVTARWCADGALSKRSPVAQNDPLSTETRSAVADGHDPAPCDAVPFIIVGGGSITIQRSSDRSRLLFVAKESISVQRGTAAPLAQTRKTDGVGDAPFPSPSAEAGQI
ncbi:hypothetical protein GGX14DRAFT_575746 [Mycena pura]|uniref:Uncharacterized protein n=1 Tax=Mycena pura TaxID=153505 RepID=A0AAD6UYG8_9AGAR|nr:hypothetical protein GGX14DRAFT_575746 [Mycena pura]